MKVPRGAAIRRWQLSRIDAGNWSAFRCGTHWRSQRSHTKRSFCWKSLLIRSFWDMIQVPYLGSVWGTGGTLCLMGLSPDSQAVCWIHTVYESNILIMCIQDQATHSAPHSSDITMKPQVQLQWVIGLLCVTYDSFKKMQTGEINGEWWTKSSSSWNPNKMGFEQCFSMFFLFKGCRPCRRPRKNLCWEGYVGKELCISMYIYIYVYIDRSKQ